MKHLHSSIHRYQVINNQKPFSSSYRMLITQLSGPQLSGPCTSTCVLLGHAWGATGWVLRRRSPLCDSSHGEEQRTEPFKRSTP